MDRDLDARVFIDLHCHTDASFDSLASPASVVHAAAARGLTHLAITDHDRVDGALRARDAAPAGLAVIIGEEVRTREGDLICVFLERAVPSGLPVAEAIEAARGQGALIGIPHPYDRHRASLLLNPDLEAIAERVDWVETWNARITGGGGNERAAGFARRSGLPGMAVSDAHSILEVAVAHSILEGDPSTPAGLLDAMRSVSHAFAGAPDVALAATPFARLIGRVRGGKRASPARRTAIGSSEDRADTER
jgi:predicted metal-dependent phosphoesterase TrpH